jgi:hypothetical protein
MPRLLFCNAKLTMIELAYESAVAAALCRRSPRYLPQFGELIG